MRLSRPGAVLSGKENTNWSLTPAEAWDAGAADDAGDVGTACAT